ncbi:MAG: hypothetical protein HOC71_15195 [Candidatus Latescibacteria bacterium]|jgi:hypothetical protein|nr:hypothetical protein [Candidatus Latescibacterota bacterium]
MSKTEGLKKGDVVYWNGIDEQHEEKEYKKARVETLDHTEETVMILLAGGGLKMVKPENLIKRDF